MLGIIGDLHFREHLAYSDYISDRRDAEEKEVLDFIVKSLTSCSKIILLGDQLNAKNNPSEVNRKLVEFIERFNDKEMFIISGNHERIGSGKTAIDFLKEIKGHNWHIITSGPTTIGEYDFLPYMAYPELGVKDKIEATEKLTRSLGENKILFCHHAISGCTTTSGCQTDIFDEMVLQKKHLAKRYKLIVGGHIHAPQFVGDEKNADMLIAGSIFNNEVGEVEKAVWTIDEKTLAVTKIVLPGRGIYKLKNPTEKDLQSVPIGSIVKIIITEKSEDIDRLKFCLKNLKRFDAYLLLEQYPNERKKIISGDNLLEFDIERLLELYAKQKKIDVKQLNAAWELIK